MEQNSGSEDLKIAREGAVAVVTLNRAAKRNSIDLDSCAVLKSFLAFAASGDAAPRGSDGANASPLADAIARAVREAGKEPAIRVGTSGVFLDVAARDAESGYVLGVAADGGDWAALRCARDRERGRDAALGAMGWRLMRAWSLSWLARPEAEAARIKAALGAQPAESPAATLAAPETGLAEPYREAEVAVPRDKGISDPSIGFASLADILAQIIRAEQPVATDSVLERARLLWGLDALSAADRQALAQALKLAAQLQGVKETRGFWCAEDAPPVTPRDRRAAAPHLRRAGAVSPEEIAVAAERLLAAQPRATEAELAAGVHRMLGLDAAAQAAVAARIAALVGAGRLTPVART